MSILLRGLSRHQLFVTCVCPSYVRYWSPLLWDLDCLCYVEPLLPYRLPPLWDPDWLHNVGPLSPLLQGTWLPLLRDLEFFRHGTMFASTTPTSSKQLRYFETGLALGHAPTLTALWL